MEFSILPHLYASVALIGAAGYVPQLITLWRTQGNAMSVSITTWLIWSSSWAISLAYGLIYLDDWRFCLIAAVNLAGHMLVIGLTLHRRYGQRARLHAAHGPLPAQHPHPAP
jgi:uncharacterized protein with PQ loop repeat